MTDLNDEMKLMDLTLSNERRIHSLRLAGQAIASLENERFLFYLGTLLTNMGFDLNRLELDFQTQLSHILTMKEERSSSLPYDQRGPT